MQLFKCLYCGQCFLSIHLTKLSSFCTSVLRGLYAEIALFMILKYLHQKPAASEPPRTNIPISSSASNENLSVDPDEAIRKRLAELRTDSAASEGTLTNETQGKIPEF